MTALLLVVSPAYHVHYIITGASSGALLEKMKALLLRTCENVKVARVQAQDIPEKSGEQGPTRDEDYLDNYEIEEAIVRVVVWGKT